jgi:hypothetical protein
MQGFMVVEVVESSYQLSENQRFLMLLETPVLTEHEKGFLIAFMRRHAKQLEEILAQPVPNNNGFQLHVLGRLRIDVDEQLEADDRQAMWNRCVSE